VSARRSINASADQEAALTHDADVAEMIFLLTARQAAALEAAAHQCSLTAAQMIRRLIEDFLLRESNLSPADPH
jgi:hypothetical protein